MRYNAVKGSSIIFWLFVFIDCSCMVLSGPDLHSWMKPFYMPLLMISLFAGSANTASRNVILSGLLFSWAGDLLLLKEEMELYFIGGLICFLITHLLYAWYFLRVAGKTRSVLKARPLLVLTIILYVISLCALLFPYLGNLKIPVLAYACVLAGMLLAALHASRAMPANAARQFITGAAFFVVSDSVLAINKFYTAFAAAAPIIILTYCGAQYFITSGYLASSRK